MKQREIYLADLEPIKGQEQGGRRPVVIISGNAMNEHFGVSIVCPITSKLKGFEVLISAIYSSNLGLPGHPRG